MCEIVYLNEQQVRNLLNSNWDVVFEATKAAMRSVSQKERAIQSGRSFTDILGTKSKLLTMPGCIKDDKYGAVACKLLTICPDNAALGLPIIQAHINLFDETTGTLKAVIAGEEITKYRTAAASAVATKYLTKGKKVEVLAILGAGHQGEAHAVAFQHFFQFKEIRIWNRNLSKAQNLVQKLNQTIPGEVFMLAESNEECVRGADVIITATFAPKPIVELEWLEKEVHINAIGAGLIQHTELSESIYLSADVFIDHFEGAERELRGLIDLGVEFKGEIGSLILGDLPISNPKKITVFQSLGMAVEDCAMARLVYDLHKQ